jgi:hypothetical protein
LAVDRCALTVEANEQRTTNNEQRFSQ